MFFCAVLTTVAAVSLYAQRQDDAQSEENVQEAPEALTQWQAGKTVSENAVKLFGLDRCF